MRYIADMGILRIVRILLLLLATGSVTFTLVHVSAESKYPPAVISEPAKCDSVCIEHRITRLETIQVHSVEQVQELKSFVWWQLVAMAALLGDAGIRVARDKR